MLFRILIKAAVPGTAAFLFIAACVHGNREPDHSIIGAWQREVRGGIQTFTVTFFSGGRYAVRNSEQPGTVYGDWTLHGDTLTIRDIDCGDFIGTYRVAPAGSTLTFHLVSDCSNRPEVFPGVWFKRP